MKPRQPSRRTAGNGGNSIRLQDDGLGDVAQGSVSNLSPRHPGGGSRSMPADALKCKECSTDLSARRALRLRALLRPARGRLRRRRPTIRGALKRRIQAGPHTLWRYADFLPLRGPAALARCRPAGRRWSRADRLAERLGLARAVGQERDREPDALVQGPRRLRRLARGAGARVRDARLRLDRQPRQRGRRARRRARPRRRTSSSRPTSRSEKILAHRRLRRARHRRRGQLRRRQPPLHRARRPSAPWAFVNVNVRPVLRRGLEDARLRDRRAARLASCPTASSPRSPPARCSPRSRAASQEWIDVGLVEGELPTHVRRPGRGLLAGRARPSPRAPTSAARCSPTRSPSRSRSATRPTARTRSSSRARPAARIDARHRRRDPRRRSACSPRPPASSPRPPAASRSRCWPSSPSAATIDPDERVVPTSPATA